MKRILILGDAGCRTGFARVVKGVADRLHATGEWEVAVRAINYRDGHGIDYAYDVQPVSYGGPDPLGTGAVPYFIEELRPDVLWSVHDPWNLSAYALEKPPELPSVAYVPVDCPAVKWDYALALGAWSRVAAYTWFGARELAASVQDAVDVLVETTADVVSRDARMRTLKVPVGMGRRALTVRPSRLARLQNLGAWSVIPHGFDRGVFGPRKKAECRREFGFDEGAFVVGVVGGNHQRKRLDLAFRAFAEFAADVPEAMLALHCYGGDQGGYDLAALTRLYGLGDRVAAVHWQRPALAEDELATLYNCFDVLLNTSGGEGFNLPAVEAAACGVPQVVPDWAGTREIWQHHGLLIPVEGWRHAVDFLNTAHCNVSPSGAAAHLRRLHAEEAFRWMMSARAVDRADALPTWDEVGDGFARLLEAAIAEPDEAASLQDALDVRVRPEFTEVSPRHAR
jgi:glycosyltransferase involved in cell wall biosynthesis